MTYPQVTRQTRGEAAIGTVCPSPTSRIFLWGLLPLPRPWTQAKGTSEPFQLQKGVPSFAGMAGLPGRLGDTQRQGLWAVLPRATGAAI